MKIRSFHSPTRAGFSLIEVVIALGMTAFCLIVLMGMIPLGLTANKESLQRTVAGGLAAGVITDLRTTPTTKTANVLPGTEDVDSPRYGVTIPKTGSTADPSKPNLVLFLNANGEKVNDADARAFPGALYRVAIGLTPPSATAAREATQARVIVTWPAQSDSGIATWPDSSKYVGSFETVVGLDRN